MAYLILVRHGKSEWNELGKWTGLTDVSLAPQGIEEARKAAETIRDIRIDRVHISALKRAGETWREMRDTLGLKLEAEEPSAALNERDYGIHTGKNKWEVKKSVGEEAFQRIRRGWDELIPEGETLKDVYDRVLPYFTERILPELCGGLNVLVVAHGNSLRALVKHLEQIPDDKIGQLEIGTGEVYCYEFDTNGAVCGKAVRATNPDKLKV